MRNRLMLCGLILLLVLVIGWATRFEYTSYKDGDSIYPVRINRYTGHTQIFDGDWIETK